MKLATHNGFLTVKSTATGDHRTFKIHTQKDDAKFAAGSRIVSLLIGPDNEDDYLSFGFVNDNRIYVWKKHHGTQYDQLARMLENLDRHEELGNVEINFEGRCRKCNRQLTDPVSCSLGIGPVCRGEV